MSSASTRFVTFPLGDRRYALDSSQVMELVMPSKVYGFPHTTPSLEGVLVRRNRAIAVCDLAGVFGETGICNFYVVARCVFEGRKEAVAIPVSGECELVQGEPHEASSEDLLLEAVQAVTFVAGLLHTARGKMPLLDLDRIVAHCIQPARAMSTEAMR